MADGELKLELDAVLSERLKAAARAHGRSVGDYAAKLIEDSLDEDWGESYERFAEYRRTGEYLEAAPALDKFLRDVAERFASKRG